MTAYKVLTHDLRPPVQGGEPLFDGVVPAELAPVRLDAGPRSCAPGYHACAKLSDTLRVTGLWPNGHPSRVFEVEPSPDVIERGDKLRASSLTIVRELPEAEIAEGIAELSEPFGVHAELMLREQLKWRKALARPKHDPVQAEASLRVALDTRELDWSLRRFDDARAARDAAAAWAAWDAVWGARTAEGAGGRSGCVVCAGCAGCVDCAGCADCGRARGSLGLRGLRGGAWVVRGAWAGDTLAAEAAGAALSVIYASRRGWITHRPDLLTRGIRTAYRHGLAVALPTGPKELGWAMVARDDSLTQTDDRKD